MKKAFSVFACTAAFALSLGACRKSNDITPSTITNSGFKNPVHALAKDQVSVESKRGVYIELPGFHTIGCINHKTATCYFITVSTSSNTAMIINGDIEGNYTAASGSDRTEDQIELHINMPDGEKVIYTSQVSQTVDANGTAVVTYK